MNPIDETPRPQGELARKRLPCLRTPTQMAIFLVDGCCRKWTLRVALRRQRSRAAGRNGRDTGHVVSHPSARWCSSDLLLRYSRHWSELSARAHRGVDQLPTRRRAN